MTEIEPTVENVQPGDVVTIERGVPGGPGHASFTHEIVSWPGKVADAHEVTVDYMQRITEYDTGYRITRITRPAAPIPNEPETVPVPADLIREAEEWRSAPVHGTAVRILRDIVQAVREREGES